MFRPREYAMIENAVVEKAHRGTGIGSQLFDAAIQWALDNDLAYIQSLMKPVRESGKIAHWIAAPPKGINGQPFQFEYVRLA